MKSSLFYLPSIGSRAEIEAGMAGMNPHYNALVPHAVLMKSIERFWTKVVPRFR